MGRAFFICAWAFTWSTAGALAVDSGVNARSPNGQMTAEEAKRLGEEFGIVVDEVDEEIRSILKMVRAEGVAVFEVIGGSRADLAGIKVKAVIKEIDKTEVKSLIDFGKALKRAMHECNFTVGTYEPADPGDPVGWGVNFHFVGCKQD
jgi:hypothetical protein